MGPGRASPHTGKLEQALWLHQQGRLAEAERIYREILQREPSNVPALHLFGVVALQTGRPERAIKPIGKAIALRPDNAEAHNDLGLALEALGRSAEALAQYDRATALRADFAEAHNNRSNALRALRRPADALAAHARAIEVQPALATAHYNSGNALRDLGRPAEALASYDKALALQPNYAEAHNNRAAVLQELRRPAEALASCDKALSLWPDLWPAHQHRGNALAALGHPEAALASLDRAAALMPTAAQVHNDRGVVLDALWRPADALASYRKATALQPDYADAWTNQAICLLRKGRFADGWRLYEWRKRRPESAEAYPSFPRPLWTGEQDIAGRTLFIRWEQGLGDTIQFCRYARLAAERGANVVMAVQQPLLRLLAQPGAAIEVVGPQQVPADFDYHCPLMSLPLAFGTELDTIPSPLPYLRASEEQRERWSARLPATTRRRIGIAWSGNPSHRNDRGRSIELATFVTLLSNDIEWFCLQRDIRPDDLATLHRDGRIVCFGDDFDDFATTAALLDRMDLVISVDTSIGHLAAAMGKPVWFLLPRDADWRWLAKRDDSPWYPTARLFRQTTGDWTEVPARVRTELGQQI